MSELKPFAMPKWGIEMSEGTLAAWQVEEGKPFAKGDVIALIETDKITNEVEAEADGCLVRLIAREQDTLPVGALLGVMGPVGVDRPAVDAFIAAYKGGGGALAMEDAAAMPVPDTAAPAPKLAPDLAISPAARAASAA